MKAYLVTLGGRDGIVLSDARPDAKSAMLRSAKDAGYKYKYIDVRATRALGFDHLANPIPCGRRYEPNKPYTLDYASAPCLCSKCEAQRDLEHAQKVLSEPGIKIDPRPKLRLRKNSRLPCKTETGFCQ